MQVRELCEGASSPVPDPFYSIQSRVRSTRCSTARAVANGSGNLMRCCSVQVAVTKLLGFLVVLCSIAAACGSSATSSDTRVSDVRPVEGFRLKIGLEGSLRVALDEARHRLYFRPLDEVVDRSLFSDTPEEGLGFELLSSDGTVLEAHPVYSWDLCVDPGGCFTEWEAVFEHPPAYDSYRFVDGSRIVYEGQRSPNAPEVSFLGLEQGQVFAGDVDFVFQLLIGDKDGDDLRPRTLFSVDGGPYESTYGAFTYSELTGLLTAEDYSSPITIKSEVNVPEMLAWCRLARSRCDSWWRCQTAAR